ncbi:hypothetical protein BJ878DRAFT_506669, partial [Calycina marina]
REDYKYYDEIAREQWRCALCYTNYLVSGGTRCIKVHLNNKHNITEDSPTDARAKIIQSSIQAAMDNAILNPQRRRDLNPSQATTAIPLDGDTLEVLYVKFIAACNMPLRLVECAEFRAFLTYLNSGVDKYLSITHNTIVKLVLRQYNFEK